MHIGTYHFDPKADAHMFAHEQSPIMGEQIRHRVAFIADTAPFVRLWCIPSTSNIFLILLLENTLAPLYCITASRQIVPKDTKPDSRPWRP